MIKLVIKLFLILIAVAILVVWVVPKYKETVDLRNKQQSYNKALADSKELMKVKQELSDKYAKIDQITIDKLNKLLPDNVDNIRLILEISKIGEKYGMVIKNVKFDTFNQKETNNEDNKQALVEDNETALESNKDYGSFDLEFSTEGTYPNFVKFVEDVEKSLRIVDISNISFSSSEGNTEKLGINPNRPNDVNLYDFQITTYWLKN